MIATDWSLPNTRSVAKHPQSAYPSCSPTSNPSSNLPSASVPKSCETNLSAAGAQ